MKSTRRLYPTAEEKRRARGQPSHWPPTPEEGLRGIAEANSPEKQAVVTSALHDTKSAITQYNKGLLTPLDLTSYLASTWVRAEASVAGEKLR